MKNTWKKAVLDALSRTRDIKTETLTEADIKHLPAAVQKYLHYTGSVGKEKVFNFRAEFTGGIRGKSTEDFMPLRSVQYNFIDKPTRLFYIVAKKMGIPAKGIHIYRDRKAIMLIKLLGLFTVVDAKGKEMDQGETVTVFNDMCFMAPATLIDKNIVWREIDNLTVEAIFTNGDISVKSILYFDDEGRLVDFLSNDRFETTDGKTYNNYPWLTPVSAYTEINGYRLPSEAKLIYRHPDEDLVYGEFKLKSIEYNCRDLR